ATFIQSPPWAPACGRVFLFPASLLDLGEELLEQRAQFERHLATIGHLGDGAVTGAIDVPAHKVRRDLAGLALITFWPALAAHSGRCQQLPVFPRTVTGLVAASDERAAI